MKKTSAVFYWMTIPAFILFFIFHTLPALQGIFYSFTDYIGFGSYSFVGLKNYVNLFKDGRVFDAYLFTFKFAIVATIIVNILSLLVALGLNAKIKFKNTFRAIYLKLPRKLHPNYALGGDELAIYFDFQYIF